MLDTFRFRGKTLSHALIVRVPFGLAMFCGLLGSAPPVPPSNHESQFTHRLDRGWNLTSFPGAFSHRIESSWGLQIWEVEPSEPQAPSTIRAPATLEPDKLYWVWSPKPHKISVPARESRSHHPHQNIPPTGPGWHPFSIGFNPAEGKDRSWVSTDPLVRTILRWSPQKQAFERLRKTDPLEPGRGYWAYLAVAHGPGPLYMNPDRGRLKRPTAPLELRAASNGKSAVLFWKAPTLFEDGSPLPKGVEPKFRIYRNGLMVAEQGRVGYREHFGVLEGLQHYAVTAVLTSAEGDVLESVPSRSAQVQAYETSKPPPPGTFEAPARVSGQGDRQHLPKTALTMLGDQVHAHLGFVARGGNHAPDRIQYTVSPHAGRPGSFRPLLTLSSSKPDHHITDLALAAQGAKLTLAWIERANTADAQESWLYVSLSQDGGQTFGEKRLIRDGASWKRGLDTAYDKSGQHHLVWGEANKIYHLKNLEGAASSVFDVHVRETATEVVYYKVQSPPGTEGGCACEACWCPETDVLNEAPSGHRIEESYVYEPALHIDDEKINIVARQQRMWDNKAVVNPAWATMVQDPIYSEPVVQRLKPIRLVVGWRQTWKRAYEEGDEKKYTQLGYQYQYLYQGTWHVEELVKIAQRPLEGDGQSGWRTSVVAKNFNAGRPPAPAHPKVYTGPDGEMVLMFEGTARESDERAVYVTRSPDGGRRWSPPSFLATGTTPQVVTTSPGETHVLFYAPGSGGPSTEVHVRQQHRGSTFNEAATLNRSPTPTRLEGSEAKNTQELDAEGADFVRSPSLQGGAPSLSAYDELVLAAWVRKGSQGEDQIVTTRASRNTEFSHVHVALENPLAGTKNVSLTARAENKFSMHVVHEDIVQILQTESQHPSRSTAENTTPDPANSTTAHQEGAATNMAGSWADNATNKADSGSAGIASEIAKGNSNDNAYASTSAADNATKNASDRPADDAGANLSSNPAKTAPTQGSGEASERTLKAMLGGLAEGSSARAGSARELWSSSALAIDEPASPLGLELSQGQGQIVMTAGSGDLVAGLISRAQNESESNMSSAMSRDTTVLFGGVADNYQDALLLRDHLLSQKVDGATHKDFYYQIEYQPDPSVTDPTRAEQPDTPEARDALYLAKFGRVWAYTQGITLAQLATSPQDYTRQTLGLARFVCHHAVRENGTQKILGWPFSWNTDGDNWQDARLVTGATAWVIHGLGVFLSSSAYEQASSEEQRVFKACYQDALVGLKDHRRRLTVGGAETASLMTAGWSTQGLEHAGSPHRLAKTPGLTPHLALAWDFGPQDALSYYSVLDAIGYDTFAPTELRVCRSLAGHSCQNGPSSGGGWQKYPLEAEGVWTVLKTRVAASNVVTEHNLDVLSVLNHALLHTGRLGPKTPTEQATWESDLRQWRDELRTGIFHFLWDEEGWKQEFEETLVHLEANPVAQALTHEQRSNRENRIQGLQRALSSQALGRVITGGELQNEANGFEFEASRHTAIDNCSWLSLSVNYEALSETMPPGDGGQYSIYTDRLAKCLEYTILQYAKDLGFGEDACHSKNASCPPRRTYRGTHYFQNAFKDPYIAPSNLQEASYHLEATMGLILGLFRFAQAHPEHPDSGRFLDEARGLWAGSQAFIRNHGFVYSSQRIQDLSARMISSTAVVWYIDTYEALSQDDSASGRPLRPYDQALAKQLPAWLRGAEKELDALYDPLTTSSTSIKDLALWLIVTTNQKRRQEAHGLAQELSARLTEPPDLQPSHPLKAHLLGYYALAWYLDQNEGIGGTSDLESVLRLGLSEQVQRHVSLESGPLRGLFQRPENDNVAELEDNVIGYFALQLGAASLVGTTDGHLLREHLGILGERLTELCGLDDGALPARWVNEWGTERSSTNGMRAYNSCSLFASRIGAGRKALFLLEEGRALQSSSTQTKNGPEIVPEDLAWQKIFALLALRAASALDPRQNEIARVELQGHDDLDRESPEMRLLALVVDHPRGAFGIGGAPLTHAQMDIQRGLVDGEAGDPIKRLLAHRFMDTLSALLMSDFRAYRFDDLFTELVHIRTIHDEMFFTDGPTSAQDRLLSMKHVLTRELCNQDMLFHQGAASFESGVGVTCEAAMRATEQLFKKRGSQSSQSDWVLSIESLRSSTPFWAMVEQRLQPQRESYVSHIHAKIHLGNTTETQTDTPSTLAQLQNVPPIVVPLEASLPEIQEALRTRTKTAIHRMLAEAAPEDLIIYGLGDVEPQDAFNPAASDYWKRSAIELRLTREAPLRGRIRTVGHGIATDAPDLPLDPVYAQNARTLRQWINLYADGRLDHLASKARVPRAHQSRWLSLVHRMVRTGALFETHVNTLLAGLQLSESDAENLKGQLEITKEARHPFGPSMAAAYVAPASLGESSWGSQELATGIGDGPRPVHDTSEDIGLIGEKELLGTVTRMNVHITPIPTKDGDYAMLKDRHQCLLYLDNRGPIDARYRVSLDGRAFGPDIELGVHTFSVCGTIPQDLGAEATLHLENLATGQSYDFRFSARAHPHCHTRDSVSQEHAKDMIQSGAWDLQAHHSEDCGDGLALAAVPATAPAFNTPIYENRPISVLQTLRTIRTAKGFLRGGPPSPAASGGLSLEQIWGTVAGVVGAGAIHQASDEIQAEFETLLWKSLLLFEAPPKGRWVQVGWVAAWEVFAESEPYVRTLPLFNRNAQGAWEPTTTFFDHEIYALVVPPTYAGPKLPLLDPKIPLFAHDITSKMAVYRYDQNITLDPSPQSTPVQNTVSPLESFLADVDAYPDWIYAFPPEVRYPILLTLFVEPELQGIGGAQSTKAIVLNRPGIFRWQDDQLFFKDILLQKQPSLPIEHQNIDYIWRPWPGTDWHVYGPEEEVDAFVQKYAYSAKGARKPNPKDNRPAEKAKPADLTKAAMLVSSKRLEDFHRMVVKLSNKLKKNAPAYAFSQQITSTLTALEGHFGTWTAEKGSPEPTSFETIVERLKKEINKIRVSARYGTLQIDSLPSFENAEENLHEFQRLTHDNALFRAETRMERYAQNKAALALHGSIAQVYNTKSREFIVYRDEPDRKPKKEERLVSITYPLTKDSFPMADAFAQSATARWVHPDQRTNFYVTRNAWRREYKPEGEFVGLLFFIEEELIHMSHEKSLFVEDLEPLLAKLLHTTLGPKTIAYLGTDEQTDADAREFMMLSPAGKANKLTYNVISILDRTLFIVFPILNNKTPFFDIHNYVFEGVASDFTDKHLAKRNALAHVPEGQSRPWFFATRNETVYYDSRGHEVLRSPAAGPGRRTPAEFHTKTTAFHAKTTPNEQTPSGPRLEQETQLLENLVQMQARLERFGSAYALWPQAVQKILELQTILPWLENTVDERGTLLSKQNYNLALGQVKANIESVIKELSGVRTDLRYDASRIEMVNGQAKRFLALTEGELLYKEAQVHSIQNSHAEALEDHVALVHLPGDKSMAALPMTRGPDALPGRWRLDSVQYFGWPDADFKDVDRWVLQEVIPRWGGSATQTFFVVGTSWARKYTQEGAFVEHTSVLKAYMDSETPRPKTLESDPLHLLAKAVGTKPDRIPYFGHDRVTEEQLLTTAENQQAPQFVVRLSKPTFYIAFPTSLARAITALIAPYVFVGAATDEEGSPTARSVHTKLKNRAQPFVSKDQTEPWFIVNPQTSSEIPGATAKTTTSETKKKPTTTPDKKVGPTVKEKPGSLEAEVAKRYPGSEEILGAFKTPQDPRNLVPLATKAGQVAHFIYVPSGKYYVLTPSPRGPLEGRFGDFTYIGIVSPFWTGFGMTQGYAGQPKKAALVDSVKNHRPKTQTEGYFMAAPDVLPPYRFGPDHKQLADEPGVLRFLLQSKTPLEDERVIEFWRTRLDDAVYAYSETRGYVLFPLRDKSIWSDLENHDHRVLMYFAQSGNGWLPKWTFQRLKHQDFVYVTYRNFNVGDKSGIEYAWTYSLQDGRRSTRWSGPFADLPKREFFALVLESPQGLDPKTSDLPQATTFQNHTAWHAKLTAWFKTYSKKKKLSWTDLDLRVRGGLPYIARFHTEKGPFTLGWVTTLSDAPDSLETLKEAAGIE